MASVFVGGAALGAVFIELFKAVLETKEEAIGFSSILNRLEVTIKWISPIIMEIGELKNEADHGKEELEGLMEELKKGVDLVRKCSKVDRLNLFNRTNYRIKLQELDDRIIRFFNIRAVVDRTTEQMLQPSDLVPASSQNGKKGVLQMLGKTFMPVKGSEKAETVEPSINRLEVGHPFIMQHRLGKTESPNDEESVRAKSGLVLMLGGLRLTEPPKEEEWEEAEEIHLMDNELSELPDRPICLILSELYLQRNYKLRKISSSFFEYMPSLQVLNLSETGLKSLPESIFRLVGLKKLFLNGCENFMMISPKVGELKRLEVLDLEGTEIIGLPKEVEKLTNLTCLKVSFYRYINHCWRKEQPNAMIHGGVISALSQLEELNIDVNPDDERWGISVEAIIGEIFSLMRLRTLKFYFPRVELLSHFKWYGPRMVQPSLSHFRFIVGHHSKRIISRLPRDAEFELKSWDRCLTYIYGEGVPEDVKKVLQHATAFYLDRHMTVKKLSEFGIENMEQLKCCILGECNEIQVIIDGEDVLEEDHNREILPESSSGKKNGLESLEYLNIYYMKNLKSIWEGPVHGRCLSFLKSLTLHTCPKLTTIFPLCLLDNLYSLEELRVADCPTVTSLVSFENHSKHEASSIARNYFLPKLKKISLHYVPELVSIANGVCIAPKLECLNLYNCPNLKSLSMEEVCSAYLEIIMGEKDWWEALEWRNGRMDNLDSIFVPFKAEDLINKMDTHHSLFLSPSHSLKHEWSHPQPQEQDKKRMGGAGEKRESMGEEMRPKPPVRGDIKTGKGKERMDSAGDKKEGPVDEMKKQNPPMRGNIETEQEKERIGDAGSKEESIGEEMKKKKPRMRWNTKTGRRQEKERMGGAGNKKESMGEEMKKQKPRMRWKNIKTAAGLLFKSHKEEGLLGLRYRQFTYSEVVIITNNFQTLIGQGGFGTTYRGYMSDIMQLVAVKMLSPASRMSLEMFQTEVKILMTVHHRNLLSLVGFGFEATKLFLIFEYMANGSLKENLSDNTKNVLSWKERLQIAVDVARGLEYLHHDCELPIIHRDVKSANILLKENLQAKVSDFGVSRILSFEDESHHSTGVIGTPGYIDPEYLNSGRLTKKTDVYGFGIVLLELFTGRSAIIHEIDFNSIRITVWVKQMLETGDIRSIVDPRLQGDFDTDSVQKAMEIATACVKLNSTERPNMTLVHRELKACLDLVMGRDQAWEGARPQEIEIEAYYLTRNASRPITYEGTPATLSSDGLIEEGR